MTTLYLPPGACARIVSEARSAFPRECCGLIEGWRDGEAVTGLALHPAANLAHDPDRFEIDPADHFRALHAARARGNAIVGCYHSHPDGRAEPSTRDRDDAGERGFLWVIAALAARGPVGLAAYVFDGRGFAVAAIAESTSLDPVPQAGL